MFERFPWGPVHSEYVSPILSPTGHLTSPEKEWREGKCDEDVTSAFTM